MLHKNLIKDLNWLALKTVAKSISFQIRHLEEFDFVLKDKNGLFQGEARTKESGAWVIMTHKEADLSLKISENGFFGCEQKIVWDKNNIIEKH